MMLYPILIIIWLLSIYGIERLLGIVDNKMYMPILTTFKLMYNDIVYPSTIKNKLVTMVIDVGAIILAPLTYLILLTTHYIMVGITNGD